MRLIRSKQKPQDIEPMNPLPLIFKRKYGDQLNQMYILIESKRMSPFLSVTTGGVLIAC